MFVALVEEKLPSTICLSLRSRDLLIPRLSATFSAEGIGVVMRTGLFMA